MSQKDIPRCPNCGKPIDIVNEVMQWVTYRWEYDEERGKYLKVDESVSGDAWRECHYCGEGIYDDVEDFWFDNLEFDNTE
jgi:hypothetical protein